MSHSTSFSPSTLEWIGIVLGSIAIALSMHWTLNLQVLNFGISGQGKNSLEAISVITAYESRDAKQVRIKGKIHTVTGANQEAYCFQRALFKDIGNWLAGKPVLVPMDSGEHKPMLIRSYFGLEESAKAASAVTSMTFTLSLLIIMMANLQRPNLATKIKWYFAGAISLILFCIMMLAFSYWRIIPPVDTAKLNLPINDDHYISAAQMMIATGFAKILEMSLFFWVFPFLFASVNKIRVTSLCFASWVLSTPLFVFVTATDQLACGVI